jgi:hypothetical protein
MYISSFVFRRIGIFSAALVAVIFLVGASLAHASSTVGTIDPSFATAKLYDLGTLVNLNTTNGTAVTVTDTAITGNAWGESFGWINFAPTNGGVANSVAVNTYGQLSGYAWGENTGWINFGPFTDPAIAGTGLEVRLVSSSGATFSSFSGYAWSQNFGWIQFNCSVASACVHTDWLPPAYRGTTGGGGGGGSGGGGCVGGCGGTPPPSGPTGPTGPAGPTDPGGPTGPTDPTNPTDPGGPAGPTDPTGPTDPGSPTGPTDPTTTSPTGPGGPSSPGGGGGPLPIPQYLPVSLKKSVRVIDTFVRKNISETSPIAKTITAAGVAAGATSTLVTAVLLNPTTLIDLLVAPYRLWMLLLWFLGFRPRPWGVVYDAKTKRSLDPAYVTLYDLDGNEIASCITDVDGRFGFKAKKGQYYIVVKKTNYIFPSALLLGKDKDEVYDHLYFGSTITITEDGGIIYYNIPMDPVAVDWNETAKQRLSLGGKQGKKIFDTILSVVFYGGLALSLVFLLQDHSLLNIAIAVLYLLILVLRRSGIALKSTVGIVKDAYTGLPITDALIRVVSQETGIEVARKVVDENGKYYCLVQNGAYLVSVSRKDATGTYVPVGEPEEVHVHGGFLSHTFEV